MWLLVSVAYWISEVMLVYVHRLFGRPLKTVRTASLQRRQKRDLHRVMLLATHCSVAISFLRCVIYCFDVTPHVRCVLENASWRFVALVATALCMNSEGLFVQAVSLVLSLIPYSSVYYLMNLGPVHTLAPLYVCSLLELLHRATPQFHIRNHNALQPMKNGLVSVQTEHP